VLQLPENQMVHPQGRDSNAPQQTIDRKEQRFDVRQVHRFIEKWTNTTSA